MVASVGITNDPKAVGYYSGLVEGMFAFAQFCTSTISRFLSLLIFLNLWVNLNPVLFWGSLSDRIGRRPVLLFGLSGVIFSTILFGFSRSFWMLLFARALSGVLNGNAAIVKR